MKLCQRQYRGSQAAIEMGAT